MRWALAVLIVIGGPSPARACDPIDALAHVGRAGDGFVFVARDRVVRVSASGEILHRRTLSDDSGEVRMLSDGRTLLHIRNEGDAGSCMPERLRFELVDTTSDAPPRVIGTFAGRGSGVGTDGLRLRGNALVVRVSAYDPREDAIFVGSLMVRPQTRRIGRPRLRLLQPEPEGSVPQRPAYVGLQARSEELDDGTNVTEILDAAGVVQVRLTSEHWPAGRAFSRDDRTLAIATWSETGAHGRGWDARLELVDLATGAHRTIVGEGTGITSVRVVGAAP